MTRYDLTPGARATLAMQDQIRRAACDNHGASLVETPVAGFTLLTRTTIDDALAGIRAAVAARNTASAEIRRYAEQARGSGRSWDEIAEALGIRADDHDELPAILAFCLVVENRPLPFRESFHRLDAWWRCESCDQQVRDHGPFDGHPAHNESGHAATCRRHAAEVAASRIEEF
ncbi:hypothetical protein [Pseudonocardia oroxyli]|uniref:Uncharacterized protein n=1 Tax=Pseudonocardia oroxyli TaxID=366584 RepID=A0A1G7Z263_PSEOR|nr:hypothetical protein [Pseudonocardia oroxyli]SDH02872.1 hypothetical protein SAMN05216377_11811 [Pseudonocardia oroxyli]